ncbi:MAG: DinB family protein [Chitinophagaceae bacterium]|nr:MAG: DinB family protein [Chitinophagaceae bacterium]
METLIKELKATRDELVQLINAVPDNSIDRVPFEGSWTAGQLLEHVDKAVNPSILRGKLQSTDRPADQKVSQVKKIFLDFTVKYQSPEFIVPTQAIHDKQILLSSLTTKFNELAEAANTLDLKQECLDFELPGMGALTRLEWISFFMTHTQRHNHQLKNIVNHLAEKA